MLLIDHLRAYEDGRLAPDDSSVLLAGPPALDRLLGVLHTAWNRIMRRDLLTEHGLRFPPGWYEDVAFGNPVLLAAGRIDVLNRVCYHYRVGRRGAITATRSARHFEVFEQYERVHEWLDRFGTEAALRARLFTVMINHLLAVAGNDSRVHPSHRRAFFRRIALLYRRHRPAGYLPPAGTPGIKHRLVAVNSYTAYAAMRAGYRLAGLRRRVSERPPVVSRELSAAPQRV